MKRLKNTKTTITVDSKNFVSGFIHLPEQSISGKKKGVILAHGAGNDMNNPLIVALADGLARRGFFAFRFNFPYKEKGKRAPDARELLEATWMAAFAHVRKTFDHEQTDIFLGGKSMGGRIVSHLVAEGSLSAAGLVFYGYPLHPPGNTDKLRDAHLYRIRIPMLFFAGTRDPLCRLEKLEPVLSRLQAPFELEIVEGGDHSFRVLKSLGLIPTQVFERLIDKTARWISEIERTPS